MIGKTLSHYKIFEKLGSGGMGEVYTAEDTKLSRKVALKVLPPEMAENAERRARFEREAKAVAALDHPNIVTIYSVEEADGIHFYTMQLVKGKTLTELIPKKGMPLTKFFEIAIPLADAVSAAHEKGIIHRDLKPDNLMVGDDGRLKILDFGLAKLKQEFVEAGASELPTQSATGEGRILGTVAYMSPEQAEGKRIDHRSDNFSIGIILYEMATGERPFKGDSTASILSSILKDTPRPVAQLNPDLPRELSRITRHCLVKDPEHRYQTSKDIRNELAELKQELDSGEVFEASPTAEVKPKRRRLPHVALVLVVVLSGIIGYQLRLGEVPEESIGPPIQGTLTQITSQAGEEVFPSLSPDGRFVAYASETSGNWDIYLLRVGGERAINLTEDSAADDTQPVFSPKGERIAFRSERDGGGLFLMEATGENVRRLADMGYNPTWSPDGSEIVVATEAVKSAGARFTKSQLWSIDVASGQKRLVTEGDAVQPSWSPRGHRIAYWSIHDASGNRTGQRDIWTVRSDGTDPLAVTADASTDWNPLWSPDGRYLYFSSDRSGSMNLWRLPLDERSGQVAGPSEPVTTGALAYRAHLSFAVDSAALAYIEGLVSENIWKVGFNLDQATVEGEPVPLTEGTRRVSLHDISPGDEWLVCRSVLQMGDIVLISTDGTRSRQLTDDIHRDRRARWSPDGSKVAFYSDRSGSPQIWTIHVDGSGLVRLTYEPGHSFNIPVWSPDGTSMAVYNRNEKINYIINPSLSWEEQTPIALPEFPDPKLSFVGNSWSLDGRLLAGELETTDGAYAGIATYSFESKRHQRLTDSGSYPRWLNDCRRLLFLDQGRLYLMDISSGKFQEVLSLGQDQVGYFAVSKDENWIYFSRASQEADIWMLTLTEEQE